MAKTIHLMANDKFNKPFVDLLNKYFPIDENDVYCKRHYPFAFPVGNNVYEVRSFKDIDFSIYSKVICHSLFDDEVISILFNNKTLLSKSFWVVWGGDLHAAAKRDYQNDYVRQNFKGYLLFAVNDELVLQSKYNINTKEKIILPVEYPLSIDVKNPPNVHDHKLNHVRPLIQINNSCDKTTIETFRVLEKFKNNIDVCTIVSYGDMRYKNEVIHTGQTIFGEHFFYIDEMYSPFDYWRHLSSIDVYIASQNRQQGTANIDMCLLLGKKVFIKSNVSTYDMYSRLGYCIYDTYSLTNIDYNELCLNNKSQSNSKLAKVFVSEEYRRDLWKRVLTI